MELSYIDLANKLYDVSTKMNPVLVYLKERASDWIDENNIYNLENVEDINLYSLPWR